MIFWSSPNLTFAGAAPDSPAWSARLSPAPRRVCIRRGLAAPEFAACSGHSVTGSRSPRAACALRWNAAKLMESKFRTLRRVVHHPSGASKSWSRFRGHHAHRRDTASNGDNRVCGADNLLFRAGTAAAVVAAAAAAGGRGGGGGAAAAVAAAEAAAATAAA